MRQAYLEIALVYLYSIGLATVRDGSFIESTGDSSDDISTNSVKSADKSKKARSKGWQRHLLMFMTFGEQPSPGEQTSTFPP